MATGISDSDGAEEAMDAIIDELHGVLDDGADAIKFCEIAARKLDVFIPKTSMINMFLNGRPVDRDALRAEFNQPIN